MSNPLVTCIMPTMNRRAFVPFAIEYFLRSDYQRKELVIVDDGRDAVRDLVPLDERIRYIRCDGRVPIGEKRNMAIEAGRGEVIIHWDDDDWHSSDRISHQVEALKLADAGMIGMTASYALFPAMNEVRWFEGGGGLYGPGRAPFLFGGSWCYWRGFWSGIRFNPVWAGEDPEFLRRVPEGSCARIPAPHLYVYIRHGANSWSTSAFQRSWPLRTYEEIAAIMGKEDLQRYGVLSMNSERRHRVRLSHDWNRHRNGEPAPRADDVVELTDEELALLRSRPKRRDVVVETSETGFEKIEGTRAVKVKAKGSVDPIGHATIIEPDGETGETGPLATTPTIEIE